ncbi:MAG: hypothetical protein ACXWNC_02460 [Anaerolineales bacterium]
MSIVNVVGGALLLALGRKIFWFFVAALGFFAGYELASRTFNVSPVWVALLIGVAVGLVGALLAVFAQKLVIGIAGFLAGAFIASRLLPQLGTQVQSWSWIIIVIGGVIGIILMYAIFEWALMILSSAAGAMLVVEGLNLAGMVAIIAGIVLFIIGIVIQAGLNRQPRTERKAAS